MSQTTTFRREALKRTPFFFVETMQVFRVALLIEHALEESGMAIVSGRLTESRFQQLRKDLRRSIDALTDQSRRLRDFLE